MSDFALKAWTTSAKTGTGRDDWTTPRELVEAIERLLGWSFVLDVACETISCVADAGFHHDHGVDGLAKNWSSVVAEFASYRLHVPKRPAAWCNPPYSTASAWMEKARHAGCRVAVLIPARTDVAWWHDHVMRTDGQRAAQRVYLLRGRVAFDGVSGAPFPSALVVYDPDVEGDGCDVLPWDWKRDIEGFNDKQAALPLGV